MAVHPRVRGERAVIDARQRRPRRLDCFAHGEITRRVYDILRTDGTATASEVAKRAMQDKGIRSDDERMSAEICRRIAMQLSHLRREGKVERIGEGEGARWRLFEGE